MSRSELNPTEPAQRERALAIEEYFDEEVAPELRRLFWASYIDHPADCARMARDGFGLPTRVAFRAAWPLTRTLFRRNMGIDSRQLDRAFSRLGSHFDRLEREIGPGGYIVGDAFSVADLTAASVMTAVIRPPQFSYALPEPWPRALVELRASVSARPGFQWVLDVYARHRGDSYEVSTAGQAKKSGRERLC